MAAWNETEFFIRPSKEHGRVQSGKSTTPTVEQVASFSGSREFRSCAVPAEAQSRRTCIRGPCPGVSSGSRVAGARGGQSLGSTNQGSIEEGTRSMSRFAHRRKIGFNSEIRPKVEGTDRESSAASIGESATVARRSNQQCPRSLAKRPPTGSNGRREPSGRGQEVESSGCRFAARASIGARDGRKSALDVGPAHGLVGGSSRASDVMQTLIDAADSTLKEVHNA